MATKIQAKAAIDAVVTLIKNDIDNVLPVGVNIVDGRIAFAPNHWDIRMDAGGVQATADSWFTTIMAALTTAGRAPVGVRGGRRIGEGLNNYTIKTTLANYQIVNF